MFFHARFIACIFENLFIAIEMEEGGGHFVDPTTGVQDVFHSTIHPINIQKPN